MRFYGQSMPSGSPGLLMLQSRLSHEGVLCIKTSLAVAANKARTPEGQGIRLSDELETEKNRYPAMMQ